MPDSSSIEVDRQNPPDSKPQIQDYMDLGLLQIMCEAFERATGVGAGLISIPGREPFISACRQDICTRFHHLHPEAREGCFFKNRHLWDSIRADRIAIRRCGNGLIHGVMPVVIDNRHLADLFSCQVLFEPPDMDRFRRQAQKFGFDVNNYLKALDQVPVVTENKLRQVLLSLNDMIRALVGQALSTHSGQSLDKWFAGDFFFEEALKKYRDLFDRFIEGFYLFDLEGRILDVNNMVPSQTGYSREELLRMNVFDLFPAQQGRHAVLEQWHRWEEGRRFCLEADLRHKDGVIYTVEVSTGRIQYRERSFMLAIVQDITQRKRAERRLRESEARFRTLFNNAAEGILVADLETKRFVYANPAICEMLGYAEHELTGLSVYDIHPPESLAHTLDEFKAQARGEKKLAPDIACLRKDGSIVYADINTASVKLEGRAHNIGLFSDITLRRNAEKERLRMQKLESLGTIAGGIAHDFNNMLTGVFGNVELAKMMLADDHGAVRYLKEAYGALDKARRLTGQLLTFARGGDPVIETVDTTDLVKETVTFNLSGSNIFPRFDLPRDLWPVKADKGQISQVFANLVINAKQAMPGGGSLYVAGVNMEEPACPDTGSPGKKFVRLAIRDEGTGIPSKIIDRIFDPYFTTKQSGTGLGLAIVHSIIARHKGQISVDSVPDMGTTFTLFLPADPAGIIEKPEIHLESEPCGGENAWQILFMDDNEMIRQLGKTMLMSFGHSVELACDGREAVERYAAAMEKGKAFDLVILDLTVPGGVGGKEAVRGLLEIDKKARVIVSSGYSSDPVLANHEDYGFCGCLVKPFEMMALKNEIDRVMKKSRA
jgi:PAS domain S-box-containing protein